MLLDKEIEVSLGGGNISYYKNSDMKFRLKLGVLK